MKTTAGIKQRLIAEHHLEIGSFRFYSNIMVGEFAEGAHVTKANALRPIQLAQKIYGGEIPIIYISNRLNSYSMDPVGYGEVAEMFPNFKGFAVVSKNKYRRMLAALEKFFIKKPMAVFHNLEDAFVWSGELLEKETSPEMA